METINTNSSIQWWIFANRFASDSLIIDDFILDENVQILSNYDFANWNICKYFGTYFWAKFIRPWRFQANIDNVNFIKQNQKKKNDGVFYTPEYITRYIVENTLGKMCREKEKNLKSKWTFNPIKPKKTNKTRATNKDNLQEYKNWLLNLKILDPACGSGAFKSSFEYLISEHKNLQNDFGFDGRFICFIYGEEEILEHNLYGVDINEDAVE